MNGEALITQIVQSIPSSEAQSRIFDSDSYLSLPEKEKVALLSNTLIFLNDLEENVTRIRALILWLLRKDNLWRSISDVPYLVFVEDTFREQFKNPGLWYNFRRLAVAADQVFAPIQERLEMGDPIIVNDTAVTPELLIKSGRLENARRFANYAGSSNYAHQTDALYAIASMKSDEIVEKIRGKETAFHGTLEVVGDEHVLTLRLTQEEWRVLKRQINISLF